MTTQGNNAATKRRITIERTFRAPVADVWELWTTKDGIESWWGPEGFSVTVRKLDLRVGGDLHYDMTATAPEQVEFMQEAGMPLTTEMAVTYTEVVTERRLGYKSVADFVPGVAAYDVETTVELHPGDQDVRMVLTFDAMHDEHWTQMATMGHESELAKLAALLAQRV